VHRRANVEINDAQVIGKLGFQKHAAASDAGVERRGRQHTITFDGAAIKTLNTIRCAQIDLHQPHFGAELRQLAGTS
jgi:hypothetical protein